MRVGAGAHAVDSSAEELVKHIVFVGGDDQLGDGQTHHACHMAGAHVAEVARRHGEADFFQN